MRFGTMILIAAMAAACGDDDRSSGDAGRTIRVDGSAGTDGGRMVDSGTGGDAGPGGDCAPMSVGPPTGNVCAAATLTCLMGATTAMAQQMCVMMDPAAANCGACLNQEIFSCATNPPKTCNDEFGLFVCCGMENCPGLSGAALNTCIESMCVTPANNFTMCANTSMCPISNLCFMAADGARPGDARVELDGYTTNDAVDAAARAIEARRSAP